MTQTLTFELPDMHCGACTGRVERVLRAQPGVAEAAANLAARKVRVSGALDAAALVTALTDAGYPPRAAETRLSVEGMTCASCSGRVERVLAAQPGVAEARVNLALRRADVRYLAGATTPEALAQAVTEAGYEAQPPQAVAQARPDEAPALRRKALLAMALAAPVVVLAMGGHMVPAFHHWQMAALGPNGSALIQFVLTAIILFGPGFIFLRHGLPALWRGAPEMNALVALGSLAAFAYSTVATFAPGLLPPNAREVYFEAAATIVALILFGRWLEARARGQAGEAIRRLIDLTPPEASVERAGAVLRLPVAELHSGDVLRVAPGERIALDGEVLEGNSFVDEAMLTGEPVPAAKAPGDAVTGGTVNGDSALRVRVTATGADTVLARILAMVEDAQATKLPVQALVDKVTRIFVPVIMVLAALTFLLWMLLGPEPRLTHALVAAISVLIIACPCAMGLATPVSVLVGTGRAAEKGVFFRKGDALQRLAEAKVIAFDKTGTLTEGKPVLTGILAEGDTLPMLRLAAALEADSHHPIARAIVAGAEGHGLDIPPASEVTALPGKGVTGVVEGRRLALIAPRFANLPETFATEATRLASEGRSLAVLTEGESVLALIDVADSAKPGSAEAIARLKALGITPAMISGDSEAAARHVAQGLGIEEVVAGVLPDGKVAALDRLKARGAVAFVGDGINDAPALASADVGIAIGTGTDVAIESAEVVLMTGDPRGAAEAVSLSRATLRNIRQNLFWAFAYNAALVPVAMGALYPLNGMLLSPMLAAGAMAFSSVFVVTNALRLRRA